MTMTTMLTLLVLTGTLSAVYAQITVKGECPEVQVVSDFNVTSYAGVWYEQKRITFLMAGDGICVNATYTPQEDGTVEVLNQDYILDTKEHHQAIGSASLDSDSGEAKLLVKFGGIVSAPYWVLGTDYTSYSVVWSCLQAGVFNLEFSWLLTRDKSPSSETLKAIDDILIANNLQDLPYNDTPQTC